MSITITLHRFETPQSMETLENLEDKLRDFLISECFDDFTIENSYTGNELSSHYEEEEEEEFFDEFHQTGGGGERQ